MTTARDKRGPRFIQLLVFKVGGTDQLVALDEEGQIWIRGFAGAGVGGYVWSRDETERTME